MRPVHARAGHLGIHLPVHNQLLDLSDPAVLDLVPVPCRFNVHPNLFAARFISGAQDRRVGDDRLFCRGRFCIGAFLRIGGCCRHIRNGAVRVQRERSVGERRLGGFGFRRPSGEQSVPHAHDEIVQHVSMEQDIQDEADMEVKQQPDGIQGEQHQRRNHPAVVLFGEYPAQQVRHQQNGGDDGTNYQDRCRVSGRLQSDILRAICPRGGKAGYIVRDGSGEQKVEIAMGKGDHRIDKGEQDDQQQVAAGDPVLVGCDGALAGLERGIHCTIPLFLFSIGYLSSVRASGSGIDTSFSNWGRS